MIDDPAATYAPFPMVTGATSCESLPMNTPSSNGLPSGPTMAASHSKKLSCKTAIVT